MSDQPVNVPVFDLEEEYKIAKRLADEHSCAVDILACALGLSLHEIPKNGNYFDLIALAWSAKSKIDWSKSLD